ncbi:MAG: acetyl-CoA carboxylase biotin carboxyl carrier protein [Candidatus Omnitrophota bacterium]
MNLKEIREMIKLMNENSLRELEIEKEGMRIKLSKGGLVAEVPQSCSPVVAEKNPDTPGASFVAPDKVVEETQEIKSPMVGTFYRAPSPEAPPFVDVGQTVEIGQVVCIVEAMKLMNEIKSEVRGKVLQALVENGEPVEFGQPMFVVGE